MELEKLKFAQNQMPYLRANTIKVLNLLRDQGITQRELAIRIKVSQPDISYIRNKSDLSLNVLTTKINRIVEAFPDMLPHILEGLPAAESSVSAMDFIDHAERAKVNNDIIHEINKRLTKDVEKYELLKEELKQVSEDHPCYDFARNLLLKTI